MKIDDLWLTLSVRGLDMRRFQYVALLRLSIQRTSRKDYGLTHVLNCMMAGHHVRRKRREALFIMMRNQSPPSHAGQH